MMKHGYMRTKFRLGVNLDLAVGHTDVSPRLRVGAASPRLISMSRRRLWKC